MLYNYTRGRFLENRRESDKVRKDIFNASAYLPLLGIVAGFLPDTRKKP